jgi:hypothetical protein
MQYLSSLNSNSKERKLWNKIIKIKNFTDYISTDLDKHLIGIDLAIKKSNDHLFTLDKIDDVYIYEAAGYYIFATSNKITLEDVELSLLYYNFSYLVNTWFYPYKSDNQLEIMSTILKPLIVDSKFNRNLEYIYNLFEDSKENLELLQLVTKATQATSPEEFLHKILEILMLVQREGARWSNGVSENINKILIKSFYYFLIDSKYNYDRKFLIKK